MKFAFDNSYARDLDGCYVAWKPEPVAQPTLVKLNRRLIEELGLDADALSADLGAAVFSGNSVPDGADTLAQAYAGHQFGGFVPSLGDGRALLLGELIDRHGRRRDVQLKGSGATPFSRGGDGRATLSSVLREYLIAEAMHALGVPTTRAAAAVTTGEKVHRERPVAGAVLTRVAASHIRVGTFQYFAARGETARLERLADYVIARHYPELKASRKPYLDLLTTVVNRQAALIARWMHVGFIHGVMNTDNTTISGETIDYGPCAFMDRYDPSTVFSSIDRGGRYAYGNQPRMGQWNLARLAEALLPLIEQNTKSASERASDAVEAFESIYAATWLTGARAKLGLVTQEDGDVVLARDFLSALERGNVDFTLAHRYLADAAQGDDAAIRTLFDDPAIFDAWASRWQARASRQPIAPAERARAMREVNPAFIPRNNKVEEALSKAIDGDYAPFDTLFKLLSTPYDDRQGFEAFKQPAPQAAAPYRTFCGT